MEEQIKKLIKRMKVAYSLFWLAALVIVLMGESDMAWVGCWAGEAQLTYWGETSAILLTACCVPVSLKLFSWIMTKKIDMMSISDALQAYAKVNYLRLLLLGIPLYVGMLLYYMLLSSSPLLCALIALTASLFCVPGEKRVRRELHILKEEDETL